MNTTLFATWKPKSGDHILLNRGETYNIPATIDINDNDIIIEAKPGTGPAPIIYSRDVRGDKGCFHQFGRNVRVEGINFDLHDSGYAFRPYGSDGTILRRLNILRGNFTIINEAKNGLIEHVHADRVWKYFILTAGSGSGSAGKFSENWTVRYSSCFGAVHEHVLRIQAMKKFLVDRCNLHNDITASWAVKKGACIGISDGEDVEIRNTLCGGTFNFGPNDGGDGGVNDPPGPVQDSKLNRRLRNVRAHSCTVLDRTEINSGSHNIVLENMCMESRSSGFVLKVDKPYGVEGNMRPLADGAFRNLTTRYAGFGTAEFLIGSASKFARENCTFNGLPVPNYTP
jgi:hypothetical protein